jgi:hypothetical protein
MTADLFDFDGRAIVSAQDGAPRWAETLWRTAADVATATPAAIGWVVRPWVAAGAITELTAKVKAGKSTLSAFMITAVVKGSDFLGEPTKRGPVVLLTEERSPTLRQALARAGLLECRDLHILGKTDALGHNWPQVVAVAVAKCRSVGAVLLVVDTLSRWAGLAGEDENKSGVAAQAMEPLEAAAASGIGVLVLRHERKSGGEVGDSGRGSSAFTGAVDIALTLRRLEGDATAINVRRLDAVARFDETPDTLVIELTADDGYVAIGTDPSVALNRAKAEIRLALAAGGGDAALTLSKVQETCTVARRTVQRALVDLIQAGDVRVHGSGVRGDPHRYQRCVVPQDSALPY